MFARSRSTWSLRSTRFRSRTIRRECPNELYRDPNKPYVFMKTEDLTDDQSKSDSTLGQTRARARAIIMDRTGLHRDVDEVRIIIGPKFDMLIKLDGDKEDLVFLEELVEHETGKIPREVQESHVHFTTCASQRPKVHSRLR